MWSHLKKIVVYALGVICEKVMPRPTSNSFFSMFCPRGFMTSGLIFKALIHSELIFVSGII